MEKVMLGEGIELCPFLLHRGNRILHHECILSRREGDKDPPYPGRGAAGDVGGDGGKRGAGGADGVRR